MFQQADGTIKSVKSKEEVPADRLAVAKCFKGRGDTQSENSAIKGTAPKNSLGSVPLVTLPQRSPLQLADPGEVALEGSIRKENIASPLGRVELRWARSAEKLFGRTPERAVVDALTTVSKTLRKARFPVPFSDPDFVWKIVVMDERVPEDQIPVNLVSDCHPAWMTPPSNIYVVAQRVAAGCGGPKSTLSQADALLTKVLLHEIGHAVELNSLGPSGNFDRARAEGFATWFEQYSADFSSILTPGVAKREQIIAARVILNTRGPGNGFKGTYEDYILASMPFTTVVEKRGIAALVDLYTEMRTSHLPFGVVLEKKLGWDQERLGKEITKLLSQP